MKPSRNTDILETPLADCWLEENILHIKARPGARTAELMKAHFAMIRANFGRSPWIMEPGLSLDIDKNTRHIIEEELPQLCSSLAMIVTVPCERMAAEYSIIATRNSLAFELFESEEQARQWVSTEVRSRTDLTESV